MSRKTPLVFTILLASTIASVALAAGPLGNDVQIIDHVVNVESGARFDAVLLEEGFSAEEIEANKTALRRAAVRTAYDTGDATAIAEIEAQLTALEIETARTTPGRSIGSLKASNWAYSNCSAGQGATSSFRVWKVWNARWQTSTGSNTSTLTGNCGDWWNGCLITDSISGNPAISWRRHWASAFNVGYHAASCT